jgi:hypothetical protein
VVFDEAVGFRRSSFDYAAKGKLMSKAFWNLAATLPTQNRVETKGVVGSGAIAGDGCLHRPTGHALLWLQRTGNYI